MASKSDFTKEEWQLITDGPEWVFSALAAADGNVALMIKARESKAYKEVVEEYNSRSSFMADVLGDMDNPSRDTKNASLSEAEQKLEKIGDILDRKVSSTEAGEYRRFLVSVAESVAEATGEGALGLGDKLSSKEKAALSKVKAALRPDRSAKRSPARQSHSKVDRSARSTPKPASEGYIVRGKARSQEGLDVIATHTVKQNETLSHISLKYYGKATKPFWNHIYEFNKDVIGDDYNIIVPGQELKIPELTDELEEKK